jgi:hypothetical protein
MITTLLNNKTGENENERVKQTAKKSISHYKGIKQ